MLAPGNLHEKLKGLFTSRSERRFKSNGMKNTLLSSRRTINNEKLGQEKLGEGNGVLKEIIKDHMTIAKKPATLHKEIAGKPTVYANGENRDALIGRLFKDSLKSLLSEEHRETSDTAATSKNDYGDALNNEKDNNDAFIGRLFKESVRPLTKHHKTSGAAKSNYKENNSDKQLLLSSPEHHHTTSDTTMTESKERHDEEMSNNDNNNISKLMKSLFERIEKNQQQDDSSAAKQVFPHKDIKTSVVVSNYGDSQHDPKSEHTAINSDNTDSDNNQNFVNRPDDYISPTPTIENLRRLKNDLNELYKLVVEERQLKHAK